MYFVGIYTGMWNQQLENLEAENNKSIEESNGIVVKAPSGPPNPHQHHHHH